MVARMQNLPTLQRRGFLTSILALAAAPAIVQASSLMRVRYWERVAAVSSGMFAPGSIVIGRGIPPDTRIAHQLWGDGIHDDTEALQALVNGGTQIPSGRYLISNTLVLPERNGVIVKDCIFECKAIPAGHPGIRARSEWLPTIVNNQFFLR